MLWSRILDGQPLPIYILYILYIFMSRQFHESGPELKRTISGQLNEIIDAEVNENAILSLSCIQFNEKKIIFILIIIYDIFK